MVELEIHCEKGFMFGHSLVKSAKNVAPGALFEHHQNGSGAFRLGRGNHTGSVAEDLGAKLIPSIPRTAAGRVNLDGSNLTEAQAEAEFKPKRWRLRWCTGPTAWR